jgi:hypothetical protein
MRNADLLRALRDQIGKHSVRANCGSAIARPANNDSRTVRNAAAAMAASNASSIDCMRMIGSVGSRFADSLSVAGGQRVERQRGTHDEIHLPRNEAGKPRQLVGEKYSSVPTASATPACLTSFSTPITEK